MMHKFGRVWWDDVDGEVFEDEPEEDDGDGSYYLDLEIDEEIERRLSR